MADLDSRAQIHDLVVRFYREIVFDDLLAPVFIEVAEVDWAEHIPKLVDFWCRVLLDEPGYDGYVLGAHQAVHTLEPFRPELFDRWYALFVETIDDGWRGPIADTAKVHTARVAATLSRRLLGHDWLPPTAKREHNVDSGGESACWAHLVCDECGRLEHDGHASDCSAVQTHRSATHTPNKTRLTLISAQDSRGDPSINPQARGD